MHYLPFQQGSLSPNWVSDIDSRLKITAFLLAAILIALTLNVRSYLVISLALLVWLVFLRVEAVRIKRLLLPTGIMVAVTMLLHLALGAKAGKEIATVFGLAITETAASNAALFCWRICLFMLAALCFSLTITPDQFAAGLWRILSPLKRIGVATDDIGLILFIAIRFIPEIFRQYHQIKMAQKARGALFGGGIVARTRRTVPLLVPVTVAAIRRSVILSDCLTVRGWGVARQRTYHGRQVLCGRDYLFGVVLLLLVSMTAALSL